MKPLKILKDIALNAVPAGAALASGNDKLAIALGAGSIAAALGKAGGKKVEDWTGWRPHKLASPALSVGGFGAVAAAEPGVVDQLCGLVVTICQHPEVLSAIGGLFPVLWHILKKNASEVKPG